MPLRFSKQERDERLANQYIKERGGKWVVVKKDDGSVIGTHDSKEKAESAFRGMEMNMHGGKTAAGLNAEITPYPPQADVSVPPPAQVYNPGINADIQGDSEHPAVQEAYQRAVQQGANPQAAREHAMQVKNDVQQRELNGMGTANMFQVAKADDVNKNPVADILTSNFDGFVPQSVVTSAVKLLK